MWINYKYAVLGLCPDLTDPSAKSEPLGILGVGSTDNEHFMVLISRQYSADQAGPFRRDTFTLSVLNELQQELKEQLLVGLRDVGSENVLPWLQDRLRNTIHIVNVKSRKTQVKKAHLGSDISALLMAEFQEEVVQHSRDFYSAETKAKQQRLKEAAHRNVKEFPYISFAPLDEIVDLRMDPEPRIAAG